MRSSRVIATSVLAGAVTLSTATPALAYDSFNASRSVQGNVNAARSKAWYSVAEFLHDVGLTEDEVTEVMAVITADPRIPANYTMFYTSDHPDELAARLREDLATDGKGIDHSGEYTNPVLSAIIDDIIRVVVWGQ